MRKNGNNEQDVIDRVEQLEIKQAIDDAVEENEKKWLSWIRTICVTSTLGCVSFLWWVAGEIYNKFPAVKAAITAFLQADKGQP